MSELAAGCNGYVSSAGSAARYPSFVGPTLRTVNFSTSRGGKVAGDDIYKMYKVAFQAPPENLRAAGFPVAVCNQGVGGGELYNRSSSVLWGPSSDALFAGADQWTRPDEAVVHMMHNGWVRRLFPPAVLFLYWELVFPPLILMD